jgi:hypothetical protein
MARGPYAQTKTTQFLKALIAFAESDGPLPKLSSGKKQRHRGEHPIDWVLAGDALPDSGLLTRIWSMDAEGLDELRQQLRAFLRALAGKPEAWPFAGAYPDLKVVLIPLFVDNKDALKWVIADPTTPRDLLLYQTKTLLDRFGGLDRLQLCPAPDCGRVYLKIGRRENCSTRCQQRLYQRTYDPFAAKPRRQDRPQPQRKRK